jgi:DNA-binding transcriptional LysR family regulator
MPINQELLRTFVAAAESASFSQAATRRKVTKSAISQQIKALESQLGVTLFERTAGVARLTASGQELAAVLRREFEAIDEALEAVSAAQHEVRGRVRIGSPGPFTRLWLRPRLAGLLRAHPGLQIAVSFATPRELEQRLAARDLDLILLVRPIEITGLTGQAVFTERFRAYAAPSYLAERGVPSGLADLARHRFVAYDEDLPMHGPWWRASFPRVPFPGQIICHIASLYEMQALAEEGLALAVLPDYFAADAVRRRTLVELPRMARSKAPFALNDISLVWRKNAIPTARFTTVRDALLT